MSRIKCENDQHRWVSGGIDSDWVCDDCGLRENMPCPVCDSDSLGTHQEEEVWEEES